MKVLNIFKLIKKERDLINVHLTVGIAFCYEQKKEDKSD